MKTCDILLPKRIPKINKNHILCLVKYLKMDSMVVQMQIKKEHS